MRLHLPLAAIRREYTIADDSPDGLVLDLVDSALDYVSRIALGDSLPSEVLTGEASWKPDPNHVRRAAARLRLNLMEWLE